MHKVKFGNFDSATGAFKFDIDGIVSDFFVLSNDKPELTPLQLYEGLKSGVLKVLKVNHHTDSLFIYELQNGKIDIKAVLNV